MQYISTRGQAPVLEFSETVMTGLAKDGGLYLPTIFPRFSSHEIRTLRGKSYTQIACSVLWPFVRKEIERKIFEHMIEDAYASFSHKATCPLVQIGSNEFIVELFHGPTLAFKDIALQFLSRLMEYFLKKQARKTTIIGATSGDTGGAAIEAFANHAYCDIFILFPKGRISPIQQLQITGNSASNVHALAIDGNFDDCQTLAKALFNDHNFRNDFYLSSVNSINWARILAQTVYYFSAAISLGAPDRPVSFAVPTGNFGDIFAGFVAFKMGLPISRLIIATNDNDILTRTLENGIYEQKTLIQTTSPSMDIQISSNFERLLFEISNRDSEKIRIQMQNLERFGRFSLEKEHHERICKLFSAGRSSIQETAQTIKKLYKQSNYFADPHTAIAVKVGREFKQNGVPMIIMATAHPAKFPEIALDILGEKPQLPKKLESLMQKKENFVILPNDQEAIKKIIAQRLL